MDKRNKGRRHVERRDKDDRRTNKKDKVKIKSLVKLSLQISVLFVLVVITGLIVYFYQTYGKTILELQTEAKRQVRSSTSDTFKASQTSLVYDTESNLISTLKAEKDVYYIPYENIPISAIDAMVVSEDKNFLEHDGVDYWANLRAAVALIKHKGKITQGASTITQQLARNIFLTHQVTYERKIEEIFVAQELEKKYSKYEILEFYLNNIYFSNGYYGIQAAAQGYFGKGVNSLSLSQMIFLCAIPNSPNRYNPVTHMDNTMERRDRLLIQLFEARKIGIEDYQKAISETIELQQEKTVKKNYVETYAYHCAIKALMKQQGFVYRNQFDSEEDRQTYEEAYDELYYRFQKDLFVKGYRIYTSIDLKKQKQLQKSVNSALSEFKDKNDEGVYQMQGAAVCIDNDDGRVVAIVGGREQDMKGYTLNRGFQSYRQPGSAIKPLIVFTPAFEREYTPESMVSDKRIKDGPRNSDGAYLGTIKLQKAVELSKNTVAWQLFQELTPETGLSYLLKMNFSRIKDNDYGLSASLGGFTIGVSPVEMAAAYTAIQNDGFYREPTCIVKIMDSEGSEIVGDFIEEKQIYQTNAARIMTEALTGVMMKGTGKGLGLTGTISAGKTGTTNDKKDGWFVGYTPYYTTSVWVGYDMPKTVNDLKGGTYPGMIWHDYMEKIHDVSMTKQFEFYDWRSELEKKEEEAKQEEELINQENTDTQEVILEEDIDRLDPVDEIYEEDTEDLEGADAIKEETDDTGPSEEEYDEGATNNDAIEEDDFIIEEQDQNPAYSEENMSEEEIME
jgi:membrane peptidoglycan carboxypeptidase